MQYNTIETPLRRYSHTYLVTVPKLSNMFIMLLKIINSDEFASLLNITASEVVKVTTSLRQKLNLGTTTLRTLPVSKLKINY